MPEKSNNYEAYNELDELIAMANNAGRIGEMEESVELYQKGLILAKQLKTCEVAVGALTNEIGRAPIVVTEEMVMNMRPGSIIIDVAVDRGGCFETTELTNHENPIVIKHDVIHYGVPNIPSGFARTASQAISNVLMHLMVEITECFQRCTKCEKLCIATTTDIALESLQVKLKERFGAHASPKELFKVASIPYLAIGKPDRKKLADDHS
mgnify:CR=1 FL=1